MNTIRRPRKRPRKRSVNLRTLGWLLIREAYTCITFRASAPAHSFTRRYIAEAHTTAQLDRWAAELIRREPSRRYYP